MQGSNNYIKKVLTLEGLICTGCAAKIENAIKKIENVETCYIDFVAGKLVMEITDTEHVPQVVREAAKMVKKIEPDVKVIDEDAAKHENAHEHTHDEHGHGHQHGSMNKGKMLRIAIGAILFGIGIIFKFELWTEFSIFFISYLLIGGDILLKAGKNLIRGQVFDENFLMSIATVGAFAIKEYPEGVAVMLFYQIGEFFQDLAVNRSRKSIKALLDIRPDYANVKVGSDVKRVSPEEVNIGDIIVVKPGEKVPLDGKIIDGRSMVDTSALTGESVPRSVEKEDEILAGFINKNGVLTIEVTKPFGESTVAKILDLIQNASSKKAPTEQFITKFARYYTPAVIGVAAALAILPPLFMQGASFSEWLYRALIFLVVSCPCALVVSIPLGFFGGIGSASRNGILIKGGNYLEALNHIDTVVFDKTGTLTKGVFKVTQIKPIEKVSEEQLLEYAAYAESYSDHPIALSISKAYQKEFDKTEIQNYEEISGHGIKAVVKGQQILAGNRKLMEKENIENVDHIEGTVVYVAVEGQYMGYIVISDEIKEDASLAIKALREAGVKKLVMLTGDHRAAANQVAKSLALDKVYAELLPHQKVEKLEMLETNKTTKGKLLFVGDGINDAPVLARADVGVAMGGLGSDAAIEAADVVLMTDEPSKLYTAVKIAKRTRQIVWQNITIAFAVKLVVLLLGAGGIATMWEAVFADVGVALIAVLNAVRVIQEGKQEI